MNLLLAILIIFNAQFAWADASRSFDGSGDHIIMGNVLDITTGDVSICIWVNMTEDADADILIGKKSAIGSGVAGYVLYQNSSDLVNFRLGDATTNLISVTTTDIDAIWYF